MGRKLATIMGAVAIALVGCGDDDDDATNGATTNAATADSAALQDEIANLSDREQVERIGEAWVKPFAAEDTAMCAYLHPDLGAEAPETCATYTDGNLAGGNVPQASFAGTTVDRVEVKGQTAVATFSQGEPVEFQQDSEGRWWVLDADPDNSFRGRPT
jgi:hypothetical protein